MPSSLPPSPYDAIARLYDPWSRSVTEDIGFYVQEARKAGGRVVELACGTGRVSIPIALAGVPLIGVDASAGMLEVCRERAAAAGVSHLVDLRLGDMRRPGVPERTRLVLCPFRSFLHLQTDDDRLTALRAAHELLEPDGRLIFDVFAPAADDIAATHGEWLEREPGIFERADWDEGARRLTLRVRGRDAESEMSLAWLDAAAWPPLLERAGFRVEACYEWFDRRPYEGGEDSVWVAVRPPDGVG